MLKQKLFTIIIGIFMLTGSLFTIGAMQVNPPANLDHVVMGNIDGDLVEIAVQTNDEELVSSYQAESPANFFAISTDEEGLDEGEDGLAILAPFTERGRGDDRRQQRLFHDIIERNDGKANDPRRR